MKSQRYKIFENFQFQRALQCWNFHYKLQVHNYRTSHVFWLTQFLNAGYFYWISQQYSCLDYFNKCAFVISEIWPSSFCFPEITILNDQWEPTPKIKIFRFDLWLNSSLEFQHIFVTLMISELFGGCGIFFVPNFIDQVENYESQFLNPVLMGFSSKFLMKFLPVLLKQILPIYDSLWTVIIFRNIGPGWSHCRHVLVVSCCNRCSPLLSFNSLEKFLAQCKIRFVAAFIVSDEGIKSDQRQQI